jgi:hypothetical protein
MLSPTDHLNVVHSADDLTFLILMPKGEAPCCPLTSVPRKEASLADEISEAMWIIALVARVA